MAQPSFHRRETLSDAAPRPSVTDPAEVFRTAADFVRWATTNFTYADLSFGHGFDTPLDEAYYLVRSVLGLPHGIPEIYLQATLLADERATLVEVLQRRIVERIPAAYLTNEAWFAGAAFYVDERVIVPRSPIAELVEAQFSAWFEQPPARVLDLCCGSGCIGIATALYCPDTEVVISDLSEEALEVAQLNIDGFGVAPQVQAVQSDLFAAFEGETFDLIVTNPPYVPADDVDALPDEFFHEPRMSLESGDDGLDHPGPILEQAAQYLNDGGWLILEVGAWAPELAAAYPELEFEWIDFERGGEGVCAISKQALSTFFAKSD